MITVRLVEMLKIPWEPPFPYWLLNITVYVTEETNYLVGSTIEPLSSWLNAKYFGYIKKNLTGLPDVQGIQIGSDALGKGWRPSDRY